MKSAVAILRIARTGEFAAMYRACYRGYCTAEQKNEKTVHPYCNIHPWKSESEFASSVLKNVLYNADGIVAINKPYGIPIKGSFRRESSDPSIKSCHNIVGAVDYSLETVLPYLAKQLDVPTLIPCTGSERYMSGVYIFGTNPSVSNEVEFAQRRAMHMKKFNTYWVITSRVPSTLKGQYHLGMQYVHSKDSKKPIIVTKWSNNDVKKREVRILNVNYKLIANSTENLSSLIEMSVSTKRWHSIRLFAATMLYSPVLGDNYHGSRVQEVMGTWMKVDPFAESCFEMPTMKKELLELLNLRRSQQEIIPCHTHLKSVFLGSYGRQRKDILIEAPLMHPFDWTCKQLMFKNVQEETDAAVADEAESLRDANAHVTSV
ncbi:hypothetical protein DMN91_003387 [Ooceraea biroi]|uniref:RNA pseudouridylate synthase domain-containing protein n=1 Tax=Ooceraea biroi TaxID=2015173 RepID=A0A026W417_OOCBI|nr:mitochondrial RNA pseudouridine synthase Rpusd4 [Ooceraea biroi]EZA49789.1 RNA pseudouridylate synthase domain-containing protein [Ooceraea biroi]RLU25294.1 hypothetical protein DMN91_003387 [Ooceraea biroi]